MKNKEYQLQLTREEINIIMNALIIFSKEWPFNPSLSEGFPLPPNKTVIEVCIDIFRYLDKEVNGDEINE